MEIRRAVYQLLVNRKPGIAVRYHRIHDGAVGVWIPLSWLYLLMLNIGYYFLFLHFLGRAPEERIYEQKRVPVKESETEADANKFPDLSVCTYTEKLSDYDVISFDVFDTLLFRSCALPTDVFYFIGEQLNIPDFKNIRIWAEADARGKRYQRYGDYEVTLKEIWENLNQDAGIPVEDGMALELLTERNLCHGNPFMRKLWENLHQMGKTIVITSDMYLPKTWFCDVLEREGFCGADHIYISCEYRRSKANQKLYEILKKDYPNQKIIHVGDNLHSDQKMAKKEGLSVLPYPNINRNTMLYRAFDMSPMIGSAYRALVDSTLYRDNRFFSMPYEYGFIYGGLFVLGYCQYIHRYVLKNGIDKILFLSRDGDILKKVYERFFPGVRAEYVLWSRKAATKLLADDNRHDYFRRFIYHKINQNYTIRQILHAMELDFLTERLSSWPQIWKAWVDAQGLQTTSGVKFLMLAPEDELTDQNGYRLRIFVEAYWEEVLLTYAEQQTAAEVYFKKILSDTKKIAVVDIGWAASGALAIALLNQRRWHMPVDMTAIVAGTNTVHNAEPDATEPFLQSGKVVSYLFSQRHNRDVLKWHNPEKNDNVFWELLLSTDHPKFEGYYSDGPHFGKTDLNPVYATDIQQGIMDFVKEYIKRFSQYPFMLDISGRDAYAPMLAASGKNRRYLEMIKKQLGLDINIE